MNLVAARLRLRWAGALVVLVATLAGCGSGSGEDDTPAVCSSVDALRSSVTALTDVKVEKGALDTLQKDADEVRSNLSTVVKDATREYADEVDTVEEAVSDLGTSLDAAVSGPTAPNIAAVGAASKALGTSITALVDAVDSTC
jgi:ABC-type glycerol-3-phosphate transport system substrate-binding protein